MCYVKSMSRGSIPASPAQRRRAAVQEQQPVNNKVQEQQQQYQSPAATKPEQPAWFNTAEDPFAGLYDFTGIYRADAKAAPDAWATADSFDILSPTTASTPGVTLSDDFPLYQGVAQHQDNSLNFDNWLASLDNGITPAPVANIYPTSSNSSPSDGASSSFEPSSPEESTLKSIKRQAEDQLESVDPAARKRMKNTEAARRSRQRKMERLDTLVIQVSNLEQDKSQLQLRVAVLENERTGFTQRERELSSRIADLERQLAESHRAMLQVGLRGTA